MKIEDMSEYRQQEYDFVFRTRKILDQYDSFQIDGEEKYIDTLLVNCMLGLLILPRQIWHNKLPEETICEEKWGIKESHISFIQSSESKNVKNITIYLRNSVSHYRFLILSENGILDRVKFTD